MSSTKLIGPDEGVFVDTPTVVRYLHEGVGVRRLLEMGARSHEAVYVIAR